MGGQGVERRDILRFIGIASVAGAFPGFSKWAFACAQDHVHRAVGGTPQATPGPYKPLFFSPQHYRMVEHLAEMIIPADDTPGAKQAGLLLNVNSPATGTSFRQGVETAAQTMAANVVSVEVRVPAERSRKA